MDNLKTGEVICKRRKELGLTQKQLAKSLNISFQAVSKWENNSAYPDIEMFDCQSVRSSPRRVLSLSKIHTRLCIHWQKINRPDKHPKYPLSLCYIFLTWRELYPAIDFSSCSVLPPSLPHPASCATPGATLRRFARINAVRVLPLPKVLWLYQICILLSIQKTKLAYPAIELIFHGKLPHIFIHFLTVDNIFNRAI